MQDKEEELRQLAAKLLYERLMGPMRPQQVKSKAQEEAEQLMAAYDLRERFGSKDIPVRKAQDIVTQEEIDQFMAAFRRFKKENGYN